jgi:hypothetical protein
MARACSHVQLWRYKVMACWEEACGDSQRSPVLPQGISLGKAHLGQGSIQVKVAEGAFGVFGIERSSRVLDLIVRV